MLSLPLLSAVFNKAGETSVESLVLVLVPSCDPLLLSLFPAVLEEAELSLRSLCSEIAPFCCVWEEDDAVDAMAE